MGHNSIFKCFTSLSFNAAITIDISLNVGDLLEVNIRGRDCEGTYLVLCIKGNWKGCWKLTWPGARCAVLNEGKNGRTGGFYFSMVTFD